MNTDSTGEDEVNSFGTAIYYHGVILIYSYDAYLNTTAWFKLPSSIEEGIEHTKDEDFVEIAAPGEPSNILMAALNNLNQAVGAYGGIRVGASCRRMALGLPCLVQVLDTDAFPSGAWLTGAAKASGQIRSLESSHSIRVIRVIRGSQVFVSDVYWTKPARFQGARMHQTRPRN